MAQALSENLSVAEYDMARADATVQRLHVAADLTAGALVEMEAKQAHYLRAVLRVESGDPLLVFNGRQGEWRGVFETVSKKQVTLRLETQTRAQDAAGDIWLMVAPVKKDRLDYLAQKATEMGVGHLMPVITNRTQGIKGGLKMDKIAANLVEAAEQCNILSVPKLAAPQPLMEALKDFPADRKLIFCDEEAGRDAALNVAALMDKKLALLIGPEGGFDATERAALNTRPDTYILSLGPRILRTDTAVVAALAHLQALLGAW